MTKAAGPAAAPDEPNKTFVDEAKKSWIEIELVDQGGKPVPFERYRITSPDGSVIDGNLDAVGRARVEGIDPGNCKVSYPDLDKDSWEPK